MEVWIVGAFVILKMGAVGGMVFNQTSYLSFEQCSKVGTPIAVAILKEQERTGGIPPIHHAGFGCFRAIKSDKKVL